MDFTGFSLTKNLSNTARVNHFLSLSPQRAENLAFFVKKKKGLILHNLNVYYVIQAKDYLITSDTVPHFNELLTAIINISNILK